MQRRFRRRHWKRVYYFFAAALVLGAILTGVRLALISLFFALNDREQYHACCEILMYVTTNDEETRTQFWSNVFEFSIFVVLAVLVAAPKYNDNLVCFILQRIPRSLLPLQFIRYDDALDQGSVAEVTWLAASAAVAFASCSQFFWAKMNWLCYDQMGTQVHIQVQDLSQSYPLQACHNLKLSRLSY